MNISGKFEIASIPDAGSETVGADHVQAPPFNSYVIVNGSPTTGTSISSHLAYTVTSVIRKVSGNLSVRQVCNYLIAVCVAQCLIALLIDYSPFVKAAVERYVAGFDFVDLKKLSGSDRLYGIGAALDVAGTRFCTVLVMVSYLSYNLYRTKHKSYLPLYLLAFIVIAVVGNMMARTTTIGVILAIILDSCS